LIIWLPARNLGKFAIIIYPQIWLVPIFYTIIKKGCFETNCLWSSLGTWSKWSITLTSKILCVCTSVICLLSLWFLCVWWKININLTYCPRFLPYVKLNVEKQLSSLKLKQSERQFRKLQFLTWHFLPCVFKTKLKKRPKNTVLY